MIKRIGAADRRRVGGGVAVVVALVVGAVGLVQLGQPGDRLLDRRGGGQVEHQRLDLGAQEVVRAARAQLGQPRMLGRGQEVQHHIGVGEVADHRLVVGGDRAQRRRQRGSLGPPLGLGQRARSRPAPGRTAPASRSRRCRSAAVSMIHSELASDSSEVAPQAVMPWPPRMQPIACGLSALILAMSRPSWNPGRRHGTHTTLSPKILLGQLLTVGGGGDGDPGVGMQVVHVGGVDQTVHRGVDRRGGPALAVQAVVERGDHLVLAVDAGIDVDQRPHPVQPQHGQTATPSGCRGHRRSPSPRAARPAPRSPGRSRCPWRRCCRRRSWCSSGPSRAGWTG